MIQHKRLNNQLMSAKVRGKHSVDLSIGEAGNLIKEYQRSVDEANDLKGRVEQLERELADAKANAKTETVDTETKTVQTKQQFTGVLDGGKF